MQNMKSCRCPHHSMSAIFVVLLALTLVLGNAGIIAQHTASMIWPVFLALIGFQMAFGRRCKCCGSQAGCGCKCGCCGPDGQCSCSCCGSENKPGKCC